MRLIAADKVDFSEVFVGASDFARDAREAAKLLIDSQPDIERWNMIWDICNTTGILKILPAVLWHREKRLLEFGWFTWSFIIKLN